MVDRGDAVDRSQVVGFLGALVAICPLAAGAQPAPAAAGGPKVFAQTGPSPSFKFFAGGEIDDVALSLIHI